MAVTRDLTPELLLHAYSIGCFPMGRSRRSRGGEWFDPDPRAILPLDGLRVSHSLRKTVRSGVFDVRRDSAFECVIRACAEPRPDHQGTWINDDIIEAYTRLHRLGFAHSIEAWKAECDGKAPQLVGGLYGVSLGGAFFGESMFTRATDASKVCLVHLVEHLRKRGFALLDSQMATDHTRSLGVIEIPREQYRELLARAITINVAF